MGVGFQALNYVQGWIQDFSSDRRCWAMDDGDDDIVGMSCCFIEQNMCMLYEICQGECMQLLIIVVCDVYVGLE